MASTICAAVHSPISRQPRLAATVLYKAFGPPNPRGQLTAEGALKGTELATQLQNLAVDGTAQTALGQREKMDIFGTDYETPDGTCVRDYIHVTDLIAAHALLLRHLRRGGESTTLNCAYGQGYSVRQVVETVRQVSVRPSWKRRVAADSYVGRFLP